MHEVTLPVFLTSHTGVLIEFRTIFTIKSNERFTILWLFQYSFILILNTHSDPRECQNDAAPIRQDITTATITHKRISEDHIITPTLASTMYVCTNLKAYDILLHI